MLTALFLYSLKASILLSIFYFVYWLVLRNNTNFQIKRFVLLTILIVSIIAPSIKIESSSTRHNQPLSFQKLDGFQTLIETDANSNLSSVGQSGVLVETSNSPVFDWKKILLNVYAVGLGLSALYILFQLFSVLVLVFKGVRNVQERNLIKHRYVKHPFSFGKWIFIPPNKDYSDKMFNTILEHEQAHLKQQHSIDVLIYSFFKAFIWYNPFVYLFNKSIKFNHECLADKAVLKSQAPNIYAEQLLNVAFDTEQFSMAHSFALNSNILNRIKVMKKKTTNLFETAICLLVITATIAIAITQTSLVAQEKNPYAKNEASREQKAQSFEMIGKIKEKATMNIYMNGKFLPVQGLPKHLKALEKLSSEYPSENLRVTYLFRTFDELESKYRDSPHLLAYFGENYFKSKLTESDIDQLYAGSVKWAKEFILPQFPEYELPTRSDYEGFVSVVVRTIPKPDATQARFKAMFKYGSKVFKMNQVDELPEPRGGLKSFIRNMALNTEKDPTLKMEDLPKKIEFQFQVGLFGEFSLLELSSKVNGSEETQDKVYELLRQLHDNLLTSTHFKWDPGVKDGYPVVTQMTIEIPKKYLN